jgi:hypothetical protein
MGKTPGQSQQAVAVPALKFFADGFICERRKQTGFVRCFVEGLAIGGWLLVIPIATGAKLGIWNFAFYVRLASKTEWMKQCGTKVDCPDCQPAPIPLA